MGFYDIHVTDGGSEFGKDFIAKRNEGGTIYQYVIQAKRGDINQPDFRNKIMGQILEAVILRNLSHSQLDRNLPQRTILMTTGELVDNAFIALNEMNSSLVEDYGKEPIEFWGKNKLIELSTEFGLSGLHRTTARGAAGVAEFYLTYSKAIQGTLSDREIENYSRYWLDDQLSAKKRILRAALEADIIAVKLIEKNRLYEAISTYLALARTLMRTVYDDGAEDIKRIYFEVVQDEILVLCDEFFRKFSSDWKASGRSLVDLLRNSPFPIVNYLVWCARVIETVGLYYFLTNDSSIREEIAEFLVQFVDKENGCGHIPGDRYAVVLVWSTLALLHIQRREVALNLIKKSAVWLCSRTEDSYGLPRYESTESEETRLLIGFPFASVDVERNRSSFLATILVDLAAYAGFDGLYEDLVHDFWVCEIAYSYWQFPDTLGMFSIDSEDCVIYPNIPHQPKLSERDDVIYSEHVRHEPCNFRIADVLGVSSLVITSVLLKDRYFPRVWSALS
jgi:hypothetical protein